MPKSNVQIWDKKEFVANLGQAAGTYDLCTASGDVLIFPQMSAIYVATAGTLFTSVSIQTDQTNTSIILSATEGDLANIIAQKNLVHADVSMQAIFLKSGQKIQYTLVGLTGDGSLVVVLPFIKSTFGATLV